MFLEVSIRCRLITAVVVLGVMVVGLPSATGKQAAIKPHDLGLKVVTLAPADGTISAREPLIAKLRVSNETKRKLSIAHNGVLSTRVEVYNRSGSLVGATPIVPLPMDMIFGVMDLSSGDARERWVVLSALYVFDKPGYYTVRIQMLSLDQARSVIAETDTYVHVLPYSASRLRARCEQLFGPMRAFSAKRSIMSFKDIPMRTRLQAIYSIRDDVVLPYLSLIAREWDGTSQQWSAMQTMRRIGTPKASELMKSLAERGDDVGKCARMVLNGPLRNETDEWYVGDEWAQPSPQPSPVPSMADMMRPQSFKWGNK